MSEWNLENILPKEKGDAELHTITKEEAREIMNRIYAENPELVFEDGFRSGWEAAKKSQPQIVRCKDCMRWNTIGDREKAEYGLCQNRSQLEATKRSDYCSRGERK